MACLDSQRRTAYVLGWAVVLACLAASASSWSKPADCSLVKAGLWDEEHTTWSGWWIRHDGDEWGPVEVWNTSEQAVKFEWTDCPDGTPELTNTFSKRSYSGEANRCGAIMIDRQWLAPVISSLNYGNWLEAWQPDFASFTWIIGMDTGIVVHDAGDKVETGGGIFRFWIYRYDSHHHRYNVRVGNWTSPTGQLHRRFYLSEEEPTVFGAIMEKPEWKSDQSCLLPKDDAATSTARRLKA